MTRLKQFIKACLRGGVGRVGRAVLWAVHAPDGPTVVVAQPGFREVPAQLAELAAQMAALRATLDEVRARLDQTHAAYEETDRLILAFLKAGPADTAPASDGQPGVRPQLRAVGRLPGTSGLTPGESG
jgi:hypothetical protein